MFNSIANVISALESLKLPTGPFKGPINGVFEYTDYLHKIIIVYPTSIIDDALRKKTEEYIDKICAFLRNKFSVEAPKVSDEEALKKDLKDKVPIIYGTPYSNALLRKFAQYFPFEVSGEGIEIGETFYAGGDFRFITAYYNPMNKELPLLIYTATKDEGIPGINSLFHGPTDYVLYKGTDKIAEGYYEKGETWSHAKKSLH